jgi:outer membrane lipoprotein-sorting protein
MNRVDSPPWILRQNCVSIPFSVIPQGSGMRLILISFAFILTHAAQAQDTVDAGTTQQTPGIQQEVDAKTLIRKAMDHWRGVTSRSDMTMIIHRPNWERTMSMQSWSEGEKLSLVRVTEPRKDAGNGTLVNDTNMWSYTPKINRIIKVPSSMMRQSWMGSDFSNRDVSKSTDIIDQYQHHLTSSEEVDGHVHYMVTSIPNEDAAVVWGREVLVVRDDYVLFRQEYWDQDDVLVNTKVAGDIVEMGGRPVARTLRMSEVDTPDEWTQMVTNDIQFDIEIPANTFTLSNLRNPRQ